MSKRDRFAEAQSRFLKMWRSGCHRIGCIFVVVAFAAMPGCGNDDASRVDSLHLLDLDGKPFALWKPSSASVTVVFFTRIDCPISNRCAPEYCRLYQQYHKRGVEFFLIYVDPREQPDAIRQNLQEYKYPCQALRDPQHTLVALCHATVTPEAVVFDKNRALTYLGRVDDLYEDLGQARSEPTTHDLADAIELTLLGRPVARPRTKAVGCTIADVKD